MGAGAFAIVEYPQPGIKLTYENDAGDAYTGWDRFGRIVDQRWLKSGTAVERLEYGYDRSSNRLYRKNVVAATDHDEIYTYDGLNQLNTLKRGTLNNDRDGLTGPVIWEEDFTYDPVGNWANYLTQVNGSPDLDQERTHNKANEITDIDGSATLLGYDAAGNMSKVPKPGSWSDAYDLTWDPWNRLVKVEEDSATVATYAYDGLTRRATSTDSSSTVRHYYHSQEWQILEERTGSSTSAERQFVWGEQRLDDLVLRDRSSDRLYSLSDPFNVTAIADINGTIQERYEYTAYGTSSVLTPSFSARTSSSYNWETRFRAYRWDARTQLYQVRYRYLHSELGRWITRDLSDGQNFDVSDAESTTDIDVLNLYCYEVETALSVGIYNLKALARDARQIPGEGSMKCNKETGKPEIKIDELCAGNCVEQHEKVHVKNNKACCARYAKCRKKNSLAACDAAWNSWWNDPGQESWDECQAYKKEVACIKGSLRQGAMSGLSPECCQQLKKALKFKSGVRDQKCPGAKKKCPFTIFGNIGK